MNNVFLIGSERSGTNLFSKMLNEHESICAPSPIHALRLFNQSMPNFGDLSLEENRKRWLFGCVNYLNAKLGFWETEVTVEELLVNKQIINGTELYNYVCEKEASFLAKNTFVSKENKLYLIQDLVAKNYPKAKYLYLVRDPRAFVLSFIQSSNHPGGIVEAIKLWQEEQDYYIKMKSSLGEAVLLIRYEDIILDSKKIMTQVFKHLELPFSNSYTDFYQSKKTKREAKRLNNWNNLTKAINHNRLYAYLDYFSHETISNIESSLNPFLSLFGYESSLNQVKKHLSPITTSHLSEEEITLRKHRQETIAYLLNHNI